MIAIPRQYEAIVTSTQQLSPRVTWLHLAPTNPISFIPGQYASFLIGPHRRPLSFSSLPTDPQLEFVVGTAAGGICSQYVQALRSKDTVQLLAPYGRFTLQDNDTRPLLFIATGTGIAPIRTQIKFALKTWPTRPATLIFGNYDEQHMLFTDECTTLAMQHPNFTFIPTLSSPSAAWTGASQLVTELVPATILDLPNWSIYICGNPIMVKDMVRVLQEHKVTKDQIHTEQYQ